MGHWGLETSSCDSVWDFLPVDLHTMSQEQAIEALDKVWAAGDGDFYDHYNRLGVVMWVLTHELRVPAEKLREAYEYVNAELTPERIGCWRDPEGRKQMILIETNDICFAMANGGEGRKREIPGLFERMSGGKKKLQDHYNLIIEDDIEPELFGPFGNWDEMISAAEQHRDNDPDKKDGIYHLTVPKGVPIKIETYQGRRDT